MSPEGPAKIHEVLVVMASCPLDRAAALAEALVEGKFAACVNLVPQVRSVYRWEGKVEQADEALLIIKTRRDRFEALKAEVLKHHPYEVPEIVALTVEAGHAPYLEWVVKSTS